MPPSSSQFPARLLDGSDQRSPVPQPWIQTVFLAPRGIRSAWRVLLALAFYKIFAYTIGAALIANGIVYRWLEAERLASLSPGLLLFGESIRTLAGLLAGICMAKIEGRSFSEYGLKWNKVSAKQFLFGIPLGLAMLALLMSTMYALRAVSFSVDSLNASEVLKHGVLYGAGYLLVGLFEEGAFRGYLRFLANRLRSLHHLWSGSSRQSRGVDIRALDGQLFRVTCCVFRAPDRKHLVGDRDARLLGLGPILPVRHTEQRHCGPGTPIAFLVSRFAMANRRFCRTRGERSGVSRLAFLGAHDSLDLSRQSEERLRLARRRSRGTGKAKLTPPGASATL